MIFLLPDGSQRYSKEIDFMLTYMSCSWSLHVKYGSLISLVISFPMIQTAVSDFVNTKPENVWKNELTVWLIYCIMLDSGFKFDNVQSFVSGWIFMIFF